LRILQYFAGNDLRPRVETHFDRRRYQGELGKIVGASRETANRCFRDWQRGGIININEGVITILDRSAIDQLAEID